ncbi:hypothetical protein KSP40_PGU013818 [Platanthera guangdongensis]|uniref:Secreted protein n=1 Tax=Platanthera guangdongensis TaxID=2320717 RepID=A0ABR2MMU3_9ASPA
MVGRLIRVIWGISVPGSLAGRFMRSTQSLIAGVVLTMAPPLIRGLEVGVHFPRRSSAARNACLFTAEIRRRMIGWTIYSSLFLACKDCAAGA